MVEILKFLCVYLLAVCVLLDKSSVSSSCVSSGGVNCYGNTDGDPPYIQCYVFSDVNATFLANVLTSCTVGEPYQRLTIGIYYHEFLELRLDLGSNITELIIYPFFRPELYINPLRQHVNITKFAIRGYYFYLETRGIPVSSYFPNLVHLEVDGDLSITTLHNFLSNLTFLSSLTWTAGSLVIISDDSFKGLSFLSYINLNRNRIPYLSSEAFEHLPSLRDLIVTGNPLNCSCHLQWMSVVDTNGWVDIVGNCDGTGLRADSPSTYSQCHNTESYQCFNKSISCENVCINTPNSYVCACDAGYGLTLLEAEEACHDIDECKQDVAICQGQRCRNTLGSYECYCSEGFVSGADGNTCVDVDECSNNPCEHNCTNTMGSYSCSCSDVDQSINSVSHCTDIPVSNAVLIVISVLQTITILALGITLAVICYLYWKRGQQQKTIPKPNQSKALSGYTELQTSEQKSQPGSQSTYTYIDEDVLGKFMKSVASPAVKSPPPVDESKDKTDDSEYMNLSDM